MRSGCCANCTTPGPTSDCWSCSRAPTTIGRPQESWRRWAGHGPAAWTSSRSWRPSSPNGDSREAPPRALGRIGDPNAVGPLLSALKDKEGYVRSSVAAALGQIGDRRAVAPLIETMKSDAHDNTRQYSAEALGRIADPAAFDPLLAALTDEDGHVREVAAHSLGLLGDTRAIPELVGLFSDRYPGPKESAARALIRFGRPAVAPLITALSKGDDSARSWAPRALGKIGDRQAIGPLVTAAERARREKSWWILTRTTRALTELTGKTFGEDPAKWRAWWNQTNPATRPAD
ncbi:MAG: HEAT repeat domain-containing protein [Alphaproteobacteria bacterium]